MVRVPVPLTIAADAATIEPFKNPSSKAEHARDDKPRSNESGVEQIDGHKRHQAAMAYRGGRELLEVGVDSLADKPAVIGRQDAFGVALRDGRRIGVRRIEQKLHSDRTVTLQVASVVVRDDDGGIEFITAQRVADLVDRKIVAGRGEAFAFGQSGDQLAAL